MIRVAALFEPSVGNHSDRKLLLSEIKPGAVRSKVQHVLELVEALADNTAQRFKNLLTHRVRTAHRGGVARRGVLALFRARSLVDHNVLSLSLQPRHELHQALAV